MLLAVTGELAFKPAINGPEMEFYIMIESRLKAERVEYLNSPSLPA